MEGRPMRLGGVVLCGGQSRRMGTSKAWLPWGVETLLQRVVRLIGEVADPVVVAARSDQDLPELPPGVTIVSDAVDGCGPLAGLAAGFDALQATCDAALVASCDQPLIRPVFLRRLVALIGDHDAAIPVQGNRWHPLVGVYRLRTRPIIAELLSSDDLRVRQLPARCHARLVPADDLREIDPDLQSLINVNHPDDYDRLIDHPNP